MAESKSAPRKPIANREGKIGKPHAAAKRVRLQRQSMPEASATIAEVDDRIAIARNNLRELVEQAASYSGAADEERMSRRIAEQEATLERLKKK